MILHLAPKAVCNNIIQSQRKVDDALINKDLKPTICSFRVNQDEEKEGLNSLQRPQHGCHSCFKALPTFSPPPTSDPEAFHRE